jgi:lipopolysaccharide biosynthesis glycosyltransferase
MSVKFITPIYPNKYTMLKIFVGYDPKESIAYHTCVNSIIRHSSKPVAIIPLALNLLDIYNETHSDGSNNFTYTRFLVPQLAEHNGWAIYMDSDIILRDDIHKLYALHDDQKAVMVVKHDYKTKSSIKYLGLKNLDYPRKNWSSVILWNCAHAKNLTLTSTFIHNTGGEYLHRFCWLDDTDIGSLLIEWNWLPDEYGVNYNAKLIHYTLGTPCFTECANSTMADEWHAEHALTNYAI